MLCAHHGRPASLFALRSALTAGRDGTAMSELAALVEAEGLVTRRYRANRSGLQALGHPVIAHWLGRHFVLVEEVGDDTVVIVDPMSGRLRLTGPEFDEAFSGIVLAAEPDPAAPTVTPLRHRLLALVPRTTRVAVAAWVATVVTAVAIAAVLLARTTPGVTGILVTVAAAAVVTTVLAVLAGRIGRSLHPVLVLDVAARLDALPDAVVRRHTAHHLVSLTRAAASVPDVLSRRVLPGIGAGVAGLGALAVLVATSPTAAAVVLAAAAVRGVVLGRLVSGRLRRVETAEERTAGPVQHRQVEHLASRRDPDHAVADAHDAAAWAAAASDLARLSDRRRTLRAVLETGAPLLAVLATGAAVAASPTAVTALAAATVLLALPVAAAVPSALRDVRAALHAVLGLHDAGRDAVVPTGEASPGVRLRGAGVAYSARTTPALRAVDLDVAPGQLVAVVGASGSGRSTLLRVLAGRLAPTEGSATAATGGPLPTAAYVGEAARVGAGTVAELAVGRYDEAAARAALERVGLADAVDALPRGLATMVTDRGSELPRGLVQAVLLARAAATDAPLLALDEPTGGLDRTSARRVADRLATLDRTCVVATRDPHLASLADQVVVLADGAVVDRGSPDDLRARSVPYRHLLGLDADARTAGTR
jgi:ABC-type bacteriocin/lantibiotic exporter with double-glycine peptidase domain